MKNIPMDKLKKRLTEEQYHIMFEGGNGARFVKGWDNMGKGMYACAACGNPLFSSAAKFELDKNNWNYGWPSFDKVINNDSVVLREDDRYGMFRVEVGCKKCGAHLGHLFDDGPKETTGEHYCINTNTLNFQPQK